MSRSPNRKPTKRKSSSRSNPYRFKIYSMSASKARGRSRWTLRFHDKRGIVRSAIDIDAEKQPVRLILTENATCDYSDVSERAMDELVQRVVSEVRSVAYAGGRSLEGTTVVTVTKEGRPKRMPLMRKEQEKTIKKMKGSDFGSELKNALKGIIT